MRHGSWTTEYCTDIAQAPKASAQCGPRSACRREAPWLVMRASVPSYPSSPLAIRDSAAGQRAVPPLAAFCCVLLCLTLLRLARLRPATSTSHWKRERQGNLRPSRTPSRAASRHQRGSRSRFEPRPPGRAARHSTRLTNPFAGPPGCGMQAPPLRAGTAPAVCLLATGCCKRRRGRSPPLGCSRPSEDAAGTSRRSARPCAARMCPSTLRATSTRKTCRRPPSRTATGCRCSSGTHSAPRHPMPAVRSWGPCRRAAPPSARHRWQG
eukprot:7381749-Prymnesium_polylepis.1